MNKRKLFLFLVLILITGLLGFMPVSADECTGQGDDCGPPPVCPFQNAPLTPGYWKTHPEAWRYCFASNTVSVNEINICCTSCEPCSCEDCTVMQKDEAISYMLMPVARDKTYTMFDALVAAKLNRLAGADVSCINLKINQAALWMCEHPLGSGVDANSEAWQEKGEILYEALDHFNNYGCGVP